MACATAQVASFSQSLAASPALLKSVSVSRHAVVGRAVKPCRADAAPAAGPAAPVDSSVHRRSLLAAISVAPAAAAAAGWLAAAPSASAAPRQSLPVESEEEFKLCAAECEAGLEEFPLISTPSGLQYRDIVVGKGPSPPVGFQVAADVVAMVPSGKVFDSSIEKKMPYLFRVGSGQVVKGLDEGILSMNVGGLRRLYVPGNLAFPKGLASAPGRPRVPPNSPVMFDVKLLYIPGLEEDEEE